MMFVLDTCIVSGMARWLSNPAVKDWLEEDRGRVLAMPAAVVVEIQRGIEQLLPKQPAKADELRAWFEVVLRSGIEVLPMDTEVARLYACMMEKPALKHLWVPNPGAKKPKAGQDLLIAATAIVHRATLVSTNVRDFARIHRLFPIPSFVCPGSSVSLDMEFPGKRRGRPKMALQGFTQVPKMTVSSPVFAMPERAAGKVHSWRDAGVSTRWELRMQ